MRVIPQRQSDLQLQCGAPCQYSVEDGETFWVETDDCYSGQITDASVKRPDIDITIMDCSVGPIEVRVPSREIPCVWRSWPLSSADRGLW